MKSNVGSVDRGIRILLGLVVIAAGIFYHSYLGAVGLVLLLTGIIGWCPAYLPFGISSCRVKPDTSQHEA